MEIIKTQNNVSFIMKYRIQCLIEGDIINNIYYEIALFINNNLYEQNIIPYSIFKKTEEKLLQRGDKLKQIYTP